jgi:hypothetical protein
LRGLWSLILKVLYPLLGLVPRLRRWIRFREGLAAAMYSVFLVGLPIIGIALAASIFIKELSLRHTAFADKDAGEQVLDEPDRSAANGAYVSNRSDERRKP